MPTDVSAARFVERLEASCTPESLEKIQRSLATGERDAGEGDISMGLAMGLIFSLAKEFIDMPLSDIETLLQSPIHDVRVGALSIMGHQASRKKVTESRKKELFDLYLKNADRINTWDLVDISCHKVLGGYLLDKPRDILYELARSENWCERRMAVYSTLLFMRSGDLDDAFKISEMLLFDEHHFIHTAVGGVLREAGKQDRPRLLKILDQHAAALPRILLRFAIEHLDKDQRAHYMGMKKAE